MNGYTKGFSTLFRNCTGLMSAPKIKNRPGSVDYYEEMFWGCTSLSEVHVYFDSCFMANTDWITSEFSNWLPSLQYNKGTIYIHSDALLSTLLDTSLSGEAIKMIPPDWEYKYVNDNI